MDKQLGLLSAERGVLHKSEVVVWHGRGTYYKVVKLYAAPDHPGVVAGEIEDGEVVGYEIGKFKVALKRGEVWGLQRVVGVVDGELPAPILRQKVLACTDADAGQLTIERPDA